MVKPEFLSKIGIEIPVPPSFKKIPLDYYLENDVVSLAKSFIGKVLYTQIDNVITGGIITETEAYRGPDDRASHAYENRKTQRTKIMFNSGGLAYVYLCYGIHQMFNIVSGEEGMPHAILIRGIYPVYGVDSIQARRNNINKNVREICAGPGTLTQGLNINVSHTGTSLLGDTIWLEDHKIHIHPNQITAGPRIGIDYAGDDANLPWRFLLNY
ncbi:MAG: DNA-3-methyladenine glycosylase [Candidatus Marinimicrobia bacterium]|jgi:DNA-3-methyladenine glycosylase|nr:DNA-3-methyladenine glycosylase [Candidatus Neomarinimicrobiota bacterium]MBT3633836.1 DNA-3-methyladenine glycosylase [Candidatus Neomarinimicrobiota bacterium]MBT3682628.1 DNA-3-methyladenine glycosylase [Candidatus Neomarinimicrobiota bacterium]MBT3759392.1 DNA-3-methyladenine glycosylase [Candidatus Neomarinimicrobiota bacterium]MBT3894600.1 DNA-3-methyladenine glycosylase [Candidatus Neomarinimicrobiota bacterium]